MNWLVKDLKTRVDTRLWQAAARARKDTTSPVLRAPPRTSRHVRWSRM